MHEPMYVKKNVSKVPSGNLETNNAEGLNPVPSRPVPSRPVPSRPETCDRYEPNYVTA